MDRDVIIVGAGISGLATAYYLKQLGVGSILIEKSERLGGLIRTDMVEGCELEAGPDSFLASKTAASHLAAELGISDEIIGTNDRYRRTYIAKRGRLVPIPKGMVMMVPGNLQAALSSPLFGLSTKRHLLAEVFLRPRERERDVSVRDFVRDHFGQGMLTYVTEPLLSGVYGGDPAVLSARSVLPKFLGYERQFGSLIRGIRSERKPRNEPAKSLFLSFRGGMRTLVDALSREIGSWVRIVSAEATEIAPHKGKWLVRTTTGNTEGQAVVLACPAHVSARLLASCDRPLSSQLAAIPYSSAALVTLLFDRSTFAHPLNGFGFLVPRRERKTIAATTWINTKFPSRIAPDLVGIRAFVVDPEATREHDTPPGELVAKCLRDLEKLMGVRQSPIYSSVTSWPHSMPQYVVGHHERILNIGGLAAGHPGLYLSSNYLTGVGIPDCIERAQTIAKQITKDENVK
ncbi:MAG: protoporphyrinogen oxidase [Bryobacteraceae bacterium]